MIFTSLLTCQNGLNGILDVLYPVQLSRRGSDHLKLKKKNKIMLVVNLWLHASSKRVLPWHGTKDGATFTSNKDRLFCYL